MIEFNSFKNDVFYFTSTDNSIIQKAKDEYFTNENDLSTNFNEWLIHDFKINGKNMVDLFIEKNKAKYETNREGYDLINNSIVSFFEMLITPNNIILKDIFTNRDFVLENYDGEKNNSFLRARIYLKDEKCYISDDLVYYSDEYKSTFKKAIFEKYNEYCSTNSNIGIEEFVLENSILIYKFNDIVEDVIDSMMIDEDEFLVYQSIFNFKDLDAVKKVLNEDNSIVFVGDLSELTYEISIDSDLNTVIGEIIIDGSKIEVEARNQNDLEILKIYIENIGENIFFYYKDEVISLDNLF